MLELRPEQFAVLADSQLASFKAHLEAHLRATFPLQTADVDAAALRDFIDLAVTRSGDAGIDTEASVQSFADHMVLLGARFPDNPLYTVLTAPLRDPGLESPVQRMDRVYDLTWDYLDRIRAPDGGHLIEALARLRAWMNLAGEHVGDSVADVLPILQRIYPQKFGAHDTPALADFCEQALRRAGADRFMQAPARALYVCTAFIAGLDFYHDPLIRGGARRVAEALETEPDPGRRTRLLAKGVSRYLDRVLALVRGTPA